MRKKLLNLLMGTVMVFAIAVTGYAQENYKNPEADKLNLMHNISHYIEILNREELFDANFMRDKENIMIMTSDEFPATSDIKSDNVMIYFYNGTAIKFQENFCITDKKEYMLRSLSEAYKATGYKKLEPVTKTVPEGEETTYTWEGQMVKFSLVVTKLKSGKEIISFNATRKAVI